MLKPLLSASTKCSGLDSSKDNFIKFAWSTGSVQTRVRRWTSRH